MRILIVGLGTIGKPLARLFLKVQKELGITEVIIHKNSPALKHRGMLARFRQCGASLAVYKEKQDEFKKLLEPAGFHPDYTFEEAIERADVVIDCSDKGRVLKESHYARLARPEQGIIAQGSEKGFGKPYAYTVNDDALDVRQDQYLQVVSCNTHQILSILKTLVFDHEGAANLVRARFHLNRRDADISQTKGNVGVEIGEPVDAQYGSHQAADAARVLKTIMDAPINIHSQADILNQPFMHVVSFMLDIRGSLTKEEVERRFRANPLTAVAYYKTNNEIFSEGRDFGHFGRILNQTVAHIPSLEVREGGREIIGTCSTPQDGNALLSSVAATLWFRNPSGYREEMKKHFYKLPFIFDEV